MFADRAPADPSDTSLTARTPLQDGAPLDDSCGRPSSGAPWSACQGSGTLPPAQQQQQQQQPFGCAFPAYDHASWYHSAPLARVHSSHALSHGIAYPNVAAISRPSEASANTWANLALPPGAPAATSAGLCHAYRPAQVQFQPGLYVPGGYGAPPHSQSTCSLANAPVHPFPPFQIHPPPTSAAFAPPPVARPVSAHTASNFVAAGSAAPHALPFAAAAHPHAAGAPPPATLKRAREPSAAPAAPHSRAVTRRRRTSHTKGDRHPRALNLVGNESDDNNLLAVRFAFPFYSLRCAISICHL